MPSWGSKKTLSLTCNTKGRDHSLSPHSAIGASCLTWKLFRKLTSGFNSQLNNKLNKLVNSFLSSFNKLVNSFLSSFNKLVKFPQQFQQASQQFPRQFQQASQQFPRQFQQASQQSSQQFQPKQPVAQAEPLDKCAVADYEQIQCGPPGISGAECEAINCCFNGQQCYYGKAVTVQCIRDGQFVVVVARDVTLPRLSLDSVCLLGGNDPPCSPVGSTPSFAIYQFPVTACGTSMMCRYSGTSVEALVVEVNTVPPPPPVAAPGPLRVELRLANGQCVTKGCAEGDEAYTSYYSGDYPVTKVLREPVYVEVSILERTDPNIVLMLGRCWATSTPSPLSLPQWDFLVDGCPYQDDGYLTTMVPVAGSSGLQFQPTTSALL
ncbi:Zona pellucida sperm-binding protein 4 [Anabarilius grahami]|uniref:Zona pellucida sperm-binding protein 4 n=1 Tax=Anabarilius grahami TaxID=495550 RepID=A0A3N0YWD5_ANAGA|nr:Zona pellucida sperm-binding protein 4 [Anabarilius grahami]